MPSVILGYLAVISLIAAIVTVFDKRAAKAHRRRVPEATLMILSALGGAVAMFVTMKMIRHKTKKPKFMIGIPLLIVLHVALVAGAYWLSKSGLPVIGL